MKIPVNLSMSLRNLNLRNLSLLGAIPDAYPTGMLLSMLSSVWHWSSLSDGGNPITSSKTDVFWDMDDCPIPVGPDPDMIYENITSALKDKGYLGEVSISTYGEIQIEFQSAGVYIHNLFIYITTTLSQNLILHKLLIPYACPKSQGKGFIS
ncbi:PREDICTED: uncharacterized protein LOC106294276 [Brassica oleracea var. oleracea]|uniref:uncharacterized protein LOC106294276 n=1 Tax=Brassica oleracea var. oleracea TaxID=109376 RepID=UPI0006A6D413|nr:PREDICTED: uncharacterized protein LOC106294276 [Brassica oleracea var. oleracea]